MKNYASLDDFEGIIHTLVNDNTPSNIALSSAELLAAFSLLLRVYTLRDLPSEARAILIDLARTFSSELIRRHPFSEGYIDFLFGVASLRRFEDDL